MVLLIFADMVLIINCIIAILHMIFDNIDNYNVE